MLQRYYQWLHGRWPAGNVEPLPVVGDGGVTNVAGLRIVGDLTGIPLLKLAVESGARAVRQICAESAFVQARASSGAGPDSPWDLVIVGGGVAGLAAAIEARRRGLRFIILETAEAFATIANFPKGKPIYTYPSDLVVDAEPQLAGTTKEELLAELHAAATRHQIEATPGRVTGISRRGGRFEVETADGATVVGLRVILAIGRSGNFRRLEVPGEDLDHVTNRLHDPADYGGKDVVVVGGGDSALEAAVAIARAGGAVTLSYRGSQWSRPKPENVEALEQLSADVAGPGRIAVELGSRVRRILTDRVELDTAGGPRDVPADGVLVLIGREPPLQLLRRCGVAIHGETRPVGWIALALFLIAMVFLYDWKGFGFLSKAFPSWSDPQVFPNDVPARIGGMGEWFANQVADRTTLIGTLAVSMKSRSFWYTLAYTLTIGIFGWLRIRRRRTAYVRWQTATLFLVQAIPLFLLPELFLPWAGYNGAFSSGLGESVGNALFERYIPAEQDVAGQWPDWGHPRAYWRAYGFILAWPLMVYNVFTAQPMPAWLVIAFVQTFVLIPVLVWRWGKGAYCGWICSCGGLAETLGDQQRQKMPHGPKWNRLNALGQVILAAALALLAVRVAGWLGWEPAARNFDLLLEGKGSAGVLVNPLAWKWTVDVLLGGILGVGLYFKYSGRMWCRFACPLAALMHIYARFSRFRIFAEKKKCISCNVCTSVCHQGIDVMAFANKGLPMEDPQCVRCSACVSSCPTGVLSFGAVDRAGVVTLDRLAASAVRARELS